MKELAHILLVDDNLNDQELIQVALKQCNGCHQIDTVKDGVEAIDYLFYKANFINRPKQNPGLILLDIKMPKMNGIEVLKVIKHDPLLKSIPVVMLTSSDMESDLRNCYQAGANAFVVKPVNFKEFHETIKCLGAFWTKTNVAPA